MSEPLFALMLTSDECNSLGHVILVLTSRHDCVFVITKCGEVLCMEKDTPDGQYAADSIAEEWRVANANHNLSRPYHRKEFMRYDSSCFHPRATPYYKAAALFKLHLRKQLAYRSGEDVGTEGLVEAPPLTAPNAMGLPIGPTGAIDPNQPTLPLTETFFDEQSTITPIPRYPFNVLNTTRLEDTANWYTTTTP